MDAKTAFPQASLAAKIANVSSHRFMHVAEIFAFRSGMAVELLDWIGSQNITVGCSHRFYKTTAAQ